jgi:hypothetical protein
VGTTSKLVMTGIVTPNCYGNMKDIINSIQVACSSMQAFAEPDSLGVIAVDGIPDLKESRAALLPLAAQLAALPERVLAGLEHPHSNYLIGWSRGKEILVNGEPDVNKGSFYANPLVDRRWQDPATPAADTDASAAGTTAMCLTHATTIAALYITVAAVSIQACLSLMSCSMCL